MTQSEVDLYTVNVSTGASSVMPMDATVSFLGGVNSDGQIVASAPAPDGISWRAGLIDPATARAAWKGSIGDMYSSGYLVYDGTADVAYTVGSNQSQLSYLYGFHFTTVKTSQ